MLGLVFHFEDSDVDVWSGREIDLDCWFEHVYAFGVDKVAIINRTNQQIAQGREFEQYVSFKDFENAHSDERVVFVCPRGAVPLTAFEHPPECWYAFGPADGWTFNGELRIETRGNPLHAIFAAPIVLHSKATY